MHKDCYVPPDRPRAVPLWHLSLLCFNPACSCKPKSERYQLVELVVKVGVAAVLVGVTGAAVVQQVL